MASNIPSEHRGLVLKSFEAGFNLETLPTPQPVHGSAIVRISHAGTISYLREIYNGEKHYPLPLPLVGGGPAIGRIAVLGPDAVALTVGQLVYVDCTIRSRDGDDGTMLMGITEGYTPGIRKLAREVWRNGTFAEFARVPMENCIPFPEVRLCDELGYTAQELLYIHFLLVPFGGLRSIGLQAGETVVIAPATGGYGGAAVQVAVAMGARVIAMGRNETKLARLREHILRGTPSARIETVQMTGLEEKDTASLRSLGPADAVLDISSAAMVKSTHLRSAILSLCRGGRVSLMGPIFEGWPMWHIVGMDIVLKGKLMYSRDDMLLLVKMLGQGLFPRGENLVETKSFALEQWRAGLDEAATWTSFGKQVTFTI